MVVFIFQHVIVRFCFSEWLSGKVACTISAVLNMAPFLRCLRYGYFYKCSTAVEEVFSVTVHSCISFLFKFKSAICLCHGRAASSHPLRSPLLRGFLVGSVCPDAASPVHLDPQQHKRRPSGECFGSHRLCCWSCKLAPAHPHTCTHAQYLCTHARTGVFLITWD